ncbi:MAG: hypothetical protein SV375_08930 [Thermodesulfobacteriota bacterium]|nr:hypothetical protein [Thermodesulfobacteriota bacterium]
MRINRREINFLLVGGISIIILLYYLLIVSPAMSRRELLIKYTGKKEADLAKMVELKAEWDRFNKERFEVEKKLNGRGKEFTLLTFLEGITRDIGINKSIQYMKPLSFPEEAGPFKTEGIEMKLDNINVEQLVNFLYKIEYSENLLIIKRIKILRSAKTKSSLLKVTLQVNTYSHI